MRCARAQYLYEDYVSCALPPETMERIDQHLAECPVCREFYEGNDDLAQVLSRGNEIAHPGDDYLSSLSSRILENLGSTPKPGTPGDDGRIDVILATGRPGIRPLWVAGGLAAAALLLAAVLPAPSISDSQIAGDNPEQAPQEEILQAQRMGGALAQRNLAEEFSGGRTEAVKPVSLDEGLRTPMRQGGASSINKSVVSGQEAAARANANARAAAGEDKRARLLAFVIERTPIAPPTGDAAPRAKQQPAPAAPAPERAKPRWTDQVLFAEATGRGRDDIYAAIRAERAGLGTKVRKQDFSAARELDQCLRFGEGEQAFREGRNDIAREAFEFVAEIDPSSILAHKASLRLADYHFDVSGDFARAAQFYKRCALAKGVFNQRETGRIIAQLSCLAQYSDNDWSSLRLLQTLRQGTWEGAVAALAQIEGDAAQQSIRSEAGRIIAERVRQGATIPKAQAEEILAILLRGADAEGDTLAKAFLTLAAAEILWTHYESSDALQLYSRVIRLETRSKAAAAAQARLKEIGAHMIEAPER